MIKILLFALLIAAAFTSCSPAYRPVKTAPEKSGATPTESHPGTSKKS